MELEQFPKYDVTIPLADYTAKSGTEDTLRPKTWNNVYMTTMRITALKQLTLSYRKDEASQARMTPIPTFISTPGPSLMARFTTTSFTSCQTRGIRVYFTYSASEELIVILITIVWLQKSGGHCQQVQEKHTDFVCRDSFLRS